jgi:hypothetical protein
MMLYRGQPTAEAREATRVRMSQWMRSALATVTHADMLVAQGRWFTDDIEIARWYAADANAPGEVLALEVGDEIAEAFRVSGLQDGLGCGLDPIHYSRDPEREFMLPPHIAARARVVETMGDEGRAKAA